MNNLNIYDDSRNRGLEVLLYQPEKNEQNPQDENKKFKLKFSLPILFNKVLYFQFESFITNKDKPSVKN